MAKPTAGKPDKASSRRQDSSQDASGHDPRFAKFRTESLYRLPSKKSTRVAVDARFERMFSSNDFTSKAKVDRYGRRISKSKSANKGRRELERLYRLEDKEEEDETHEGKQDGGSKVEKKKAGKKVTFEEGFEGATSEDEDDDGGVSLASDDEVERELRRADMVGREYNPATDGGFSQSSSSEEDTDDDDSEEESDLDEDVEESGLAAKQDHDVPEGEVSRRLAVVNLDWDNIRAVDLFALLKSFATSGGRIEKVTVYPSEFGKERLAREELEGPPKELFTAKKVSTETLDDGDEDEESEDDDEEDEESDAEDDEDEEEEDERIKQSIIQEDTGEDFDSAQLRTYQLERLRYYYAVVDCSSKSTAQEIYNAVDGMEYLSTANFLDLRFIPDETDFSDDKPRDSCKVVPDGYKPNNFSTHALQHSKVKLTWDMDDTNRKETLARAFSREQIEENDLKAYLASDSSDDEHLEPEVVDATEVTTQQQQADVTEETQNGDAKLSAKELRRQQAREKLGLPPEPTVGGRSKRDEHTGDMQITFSMGLDGDKGGSVFQNEPIGEETTVEKYIRKERERKARRKEKMKAAREATNGEADDTNTGDQAATAEANEDEAEDLGFDDPFFTEPASTKTKGKDSGASSKKNLTKEEKRQKRQAKEAEESRLASERAALAEVMGEDGINDDGTGTGAGVRHFDMHDLKKAERTLRKTKGSKKARLKAGERAAIAAKRDDDFTMNVADPRFAGRLDQSAFAVDASHPSFAATDGMQALLEERRRKRARETAEEQYGDGAEDDGRRRKGKKARGDEEDLSGLVQRVKGRSVR